MIYGEGAQKISLVSEPPIYVQPVYDKGEVETVHKVIGFDNYFNHEKYYDVVKKRHSTLENPLVSSQSLGYQVRGQIFDLQA